MSWRVNPILYIKKTMDRLPRDLWVQIFLRLPVKTILRCLSVCKLWQLFIQHPSFIDSHLQHQRRDLMLVRSIIPDNGNKNHSDSEEITLAVKAKHEKKPECYSLYCDDDSFTLHAKHDFPILHPWGGHYRVVGTCNGIVCITNDEVSISHETYLWNPTIQKCVEISCPEFIYKKIGAFDHELGFGFDEKTNDYKVIRIVQSDIGLEYDHPLEVEICSLSTNVWRKVSHLASGLNFRIFERYGSGRNYQVYFNRAVHWVCMERKLTRCIVIAFHLSDEVFCCFEVPSDMKQDCYSIMSMRNLRPIVFQGSLSLIRYSRPKCSIWMMKNYGDSTSWAKYVDLKISNYVDRVIGLRKNGEFLIEIQGGLYSYVPIEGKELMYLDERDFRFWKLIQEGHMEVINFVRQEVLDYDPEYAPKELGIRSKTKDDFSFSFYSEVYTESMVLLGSMKYAVVAELKKKKEVAELSEKEPEKIHKEEKNHGADTANDLQDLIEEGRQC